MADLQTKKRKLENEEGSQISESEVMAMLDLWDQDQLKKVLAKIGSQSVAALDEIRAEVNADPKMRKIFVRNLPFTANDESLKQLFSQYGTIEEAVIIMDKMKNQSKGFGFVTFETVEGTQAALAETTKEFEGRQVFVNLAAKKEQSLAAASQGGSGIPSNAASEDVVYRKLFVRSLSYETTSNDLTEFFGSFGEVAEAIVLTNRDTGTSKGYGFVTMATATGAKASMVEPSKQLAGRTIHVKLAATNDGNRTSHPSAQQAPPPYMPQAQFMGQWGGQQMQYGQQQFGQYPQQGYQAPQAQQTPQFGQQQQQW